MIYWSANGGAMHPHVYLRRKVHHASIRTHGITATTRINRSNIMLHSGEEWKSFIEEFFAQELEFFVYMSVNSFITLCNQLLNVKYCKRSWIRVDEFEEFSLKILFVADADAIKKNAQEKVPIFLRKIRIPNNVRSNALVHRSWRPVST